MALCPRGQVISAIPGVFYGKHSARCRASSSYRCAWEGPTISCGGARQSALAARVLYARPRAGLQSLPACNARTSA